MRFIFNVGIKGDRSCVIDHYAPQTIALYSLLDRGHRAFLCHIPSNPPSVKRTRGESGNPAEVAVCHGGYPKARTKLERNRLVTDEGSTLDTAFKLSDGYDGTMIRIACCWPIIEKSPLVR